MVLVLAIMYASILLHRFCFVFCAHSYLDVVTTKPIYFNVNSSVVGTPQIMQGNPPAFLGFFLCPIAGIS